MYKKNNKKNKKILAKKQKNNINLQLKNIEAHIINGVFIYNKKLTVFEFAQKINKSIDEINKYFLNKEIVLNENSFLNENQLGELCLEFGLDFKKEKQITYENLIENFKIDDDPIFLKKRDPIVTIMGHVDHGKTTLLNSIRNTNIVTTEQGGITQYIKGYKIEIKNNEKITFIDTPGHEDFVQMRLRGSIITDIIVLVIAADDGIMLQTKEVIKYIKISKIPVIIFINKIDKINVNLDNIFKQLLKEELIIEKLGGSIPCIKGSAKQKKGINELLDTILLISNLMELKANPNRFAIGTVIESQFYYGLGPVSTLLVQSGTLNIKDALVAGCVFGYVRNLYNDKGEKIKSAGPSTPVMINGLNELPNAGDRFMVFQDEKLAREISLKRKKNNILNKSYKNKNFSLENLSIQIKNEKLKQINIILKTDTKGTVEAIKTSLLKINISGIKINILRANVGLILESDITLGVTSKALIIGFNIFITKHIYKKAKDEKVKIILHTIIYKLKEEIITIAKKILDPKIIEEILGQAKIKQIFFHSNIGTIAGCFVFNGFISIKSQIRILRKNIIIYYGELESLKINKNDVKEVKLNTECGLKIKNFNDLKKEDIIESYIKKMT